MTHLACADDVADPLNESQLRGFADEINVGYEGLFSESILSVNGKLPRDIHHLVSLIDGSKERVEIRTSSNSLIMLDVNEVRARTTTILERYRIERDRSLDLMAKPGAPKAALKPQKHANGRAKKIAKPSPV